MARTGKVAKKISIDAQQLLPLSEPVHHLNQPEQDHNVVAPFADHENVHCLLEHPHGSLWHGDAIEWLKHITTGSIDLVFADPPYNLHKAEWDSFADQQAYVDWSIEWIKEAARVLKPTGSLYISGFSETLADIKLPALAYFAGCRWLVWHCELPRSERQRGCGHERLKHRPARASLPDSVGRNPRYVRKVMTPAVDASDRCSVADS